MKKSAATILILFILATAWLSMSWLAPESSHPITESAPIQPVLRFGEKNFELDQATRPWIAPSDLRNSFFISPDPESIEVVYTHQGRQIWQENVENGENLPIPSNDGITAISFHVLFPNEKQPREKELFVATQRPIDVQVNQTSFLPGELVVLHLKFLDPGQQVAVSGSWFSVEPQWFRSKNEGIVLYPIPSSTRPGDYHVTIAPEYEQPIRLSISIEDRDFVMQALTIDPNVNASTRNDDSYEEFHEMLVASRNVTESTALFDSVFVLPLEGRMTTEYGQGRTVNGVPSGSRHSGYDLAAPTGTEFGAAQAGKVRFAGELTLTGNTVILEHGLGIFSQYYHMDTLAVEAGEKVQQSQILGTVGSTGFSTGPHLHYCVYVNGAYVDPAVFMDPSFADWIQLLPQ